MYMDTFFFIAKTYLLIGCLTPLVGIILNSISHREKPDFTFGETKLVDIIQVYCISIFAWPIAIACAIIAHSRGRWL
ncbi:MULTISPECIES: hypothetical protein [Bacillus cereus group]|nr:hypothetical protein [Bacillus thuringiensis]EEM25547.1 hypothetical protein bthur0002_61900 [Bacillus thuringiensis Bt407]PQZ78212.1 hypothetical protein CQ064_10395 [Bacillus sp. MYb78]MEC2681911.1 hypothetical protein [Bacillus thuringiensis]MEC3449155.1 hypothetical protein [Bacillus thuringiensis]MED2527782.1 hypothetical protein [Bacillus thuringiensis]